MSAADAVGLAEWLRDNIADELVRADRSTVERLLVGSQVHAERRTHEMEAAVDLLTGLGVPARVSQASRDWLEQLASARRGGSEAHG